MRKTIKKLKGKLAKWLMKDCPIMQPIQPMIIENNSLKKFHAQKIIPYWEWQHANVEPDCFVRTFKFEIVNQLLNEILIKVSETPEGIKYETDLLFENI